MRNTLLCREKWKRTADKATQRKAENLQQQLWTYGVWFCGCPWDQLGCLQGQIHFHHNNMKTLICVFCCTDTLMTGAKAIAGKISQEHRSDQDARTSILVVISTPFIYWKQIQNTKLPRRSLVKHWKRLTVYNFNPWVHVTSKASSPQGAISKFWGESKLYIDFQLHGSRLP